MAGGSGDTLPPPDLSPAGIVRHQIVALVRGPMLAMLLAKALEGSWRGLAAAWPYGDRALFVASTFAVHLVLYATCNGLAALCDSRGWLARYKMPRTRGQVPGDELVQQTVRDAAVGQTLVGPLLLAAVYTLLAYFGMPAAESPLPGAGTVWLQMVACVAFNEVGFYTMHRLLHHPALYARVHKQHHRYAGTIGIAAEFAHPVEQLLANYIPTIGAVLFGGFHMLVWLVWLAWRLTETYEAHSGYNFKGTLLDRVGLLNSDHARHHDFHHSANSGAYGSVFMDYVGGTLDAYREHIEKCKSK